MAYVAIATDASSISKKTLVGTGQTPEAALVGVKQRIEAHCKNELAEEDEDSIAPDILEDRMSDWVLSRPQYVEESKDPFLRIIEEHLSKQMAYNYSAVIIADRWHLQMDGHYYVYDREASTDDHVCFKRTSGLLSKSIFIERTPEWKKWAAPQNFDINHPARLKG